MAVSGISGSSPTSALTGTRQGIADNFDTFLQLLTTQLRNQNPLDPLDTNQFTQQLVQFSSVEQQIKTNDFLSAMMLSSQTAAASNAVGYIGREVTASGVRSELVNGKASWMFQLDRDAPEVTVTIKDNEGNVVHTETGALKAGTGVYNWDGMGNNGKPMPEGTYSITIDARDADGGRVTAVTQMRGKVTGVDMTGSEPVLLVSNARVNLSSVMSVVATD